MPILETSASKAEKEIRKILSAEENVFRPWQLVDYEPVSLTLQTTADEIEILYNKQAFLRPGFKVEEGKVHIPNLFIKLSGNNFDFLDMLTCPTDDDKPKIVYNSTSDFIIKKDMRNDKKEIEKILNAEGLIDKEKLYKSSLYKYYFLRKEYQDTLIDKINYILKNKNQIFTPNVDVENTQRIIYTLLNIDKDIMMLFHNFDYQYDIPSIIFYDEEYSSFSDRIAYALALLYLLGMDIIIISATGYANLENVIQSDLFSIFYSDTIKEKLKSYQPVNGKSGEKMSKEISKSENTTPKTENLKLLAIKTKLKTPLLLIPLLVWFVIVPWTWFTETYMLNIYKPMDFINGNFEYFYVGFEDKDVYEGDTVNERPNGNGTVHFDNGDIYEGQWQDGRIYGTGKMKMVSIFYNDPYNPGYIYSGEWLNNQMDGHGTMDFGEHKYVGEWHDNAMEGEGMFYFANGYKYEGEFQLNQFQGEGTYYDPQGNIVFKGRWDESVPQKRFSDYRFITKLSRILITIFVFLVIMSKLISRHRAIKDKSNEKSA